MRRATSVLPSNLVQKAIREGLLVRPGACGRCGVSCKPEGHHADYLRPLDVEWLCKTCHVAADMERREAEAQRLFGELALAAVTVTFKSGRVQTLGPKDIRHVEGYFHHDYTLSLGLELTIVRGDEQIAVPSEQREPE